MSSEYKIYRCNICGIMIEVLNGDRGHLVCCGKDMELLNEKTQDAGNEKHVPVIEKADGKIIVKVGEVSHPMVEDHYIEWVEIECCGNISRHHFKPGDEPKAEFDACCDNYVAREYCSKHGLWSSK